MHPVVKRRQQLQQFNLSLKQGSISGHVVTISGVAIRLQMIIRYGSTVYLMVRGHVKSVKTLNRDMIGSTYIHYIYLFLKYTLFLFICEKDN
jgi:hypothetical protein